MSYCATIIHIPWLLRESPFDFLLTEDTTPIIWCNKITCKEDDLNRIIGDEAEFLVKMEGQVLLETKDFIHAFQVYLASFYVLT